MFPLFDAVLGGEFWERIGCELSISWIDKGLSSLGPIEDCEGLLDSIGTLVGRTCSGTIGLDAEVGLETSENGMENRLALVPVGADTTS
jgi:hypothetical protein